MRTVDYLRHEYTWPDPEPRTASLIAFVYDIPYFAACGVFPPLKFANEKFRSGGSQGGMSPGATWEPFEVSENEYKELIKLVQTTNPESLSKQARYIFDKFIFDHDFDEVLDYENWLFKVCEKHRDAFHKRVQGRLKPNRG